MVKKKPWLQPGTLFQRSYLKEMIGSRLHFGYLWEPLGGSRGGPKSSKKWVQKRTPIENPFKSLRTLPIFVDGWSARGRRAVDGRLTPAVWNPRLAGEVRRGTLRVGE